MYIQFICINTCTYFTVALLDPEQIEEPEEEAKGTKPTSTPPSTPIRAEEGTFTWLWPGMALALPGASWVIRTTVTDHLLGVYSRNMEAPSH